jgi:hypothetical protein
MSASFCFPTQRKIAALYGSRSIDGTSVGPPKKACLIRTFFKCEMLPIHEKAMCPSELVKIHLEIRSKALGISFLKIDKSGLSATGAATLALEGCHKKKEGKIVDGGWL